MIKTLFSIQLCWMCVFPFMGCQKYTSDMRTYPPVPFYPDYIMSAAKNFSATKFPESGEATQYKDTLIFQYIEFNKVDSTYHTIVNQYGQNAWENIQKRLTRYDQYVRGGTFKFIVNIEASNVPKEMTYIIPISQFKIE